MGETSVVSKWIQGVRRGSRAHHQAQTPFVVWTWDWHVLDFTRITPPSILSGMRKGTRAPVMDIALRALHDLDSITSVTKQ